MRVRGLDAGKWRSRGDVDFNGAAVAADVGRVGVAVGRQVLLGPTSCPSGGDSGSSNGGSTSCLRGDDAVVWDSCFAMQRC